MPRLDGIGLVERVRANPATARMPVIVMSGWFGGDDHPLPLGVDAFVRKPVRTAELVELLARFAGSTDSQVERDRGILISSTIQVLQVLEHTGLVEARSGSRAGTLQLVAGELIGAATDELSGEAAARQILTWTQTEVKLRKIDDWVADEMIRVPLNDLLALPGWTGQPTTLAVALVEELDPVNAGVAFAEVEWSAPSDASREPSPFQWSDLPQMATPDGDGPAPQTAALVTLAVASEPIPTNHDAGAMALIDEAISIRGAIAAALIDERDGTTLRETDDSDSDIAPLTSAMSRLVVSKRGLLASLGQHEAIESVIVDLSNRVLILRPLARERPIYLVVVLDKKRATLALALCGLEKIETQIQPE
jgi:hypothetical protein